jgi:cysteine desulfurase
VSKPTIYLDYNATAPIRPEARDAVLRAFEAAGNPSSVHASGRAARDLVETARAQVAALVGVVPGSVTFVSGGTEANALAIGSAAFAGFNRIIVSEGEHDAVLETAKPHRACRSKMPLDADGVARLDWLEEALRSDEGRALVCLMLANNETGVIQPIAEASALVRAADGWLHVDAVQAAGKIAIDFTALGADTLALSAHKLGGPQGVGALVAGTRATVVRQQHGGGQERGRRAGTENVAGIAGFGAAATAARPRLALDGQSRHMARRLGRTAQGRWRCRARGGRSAPASNPVFGGRRLRLADPGDEPGPGRGDGQRRQRLLVGQGQGQPRGGSHGPGDLAPFALRVSGGWASTSKTGFPAATPGSPPIRVSALGAGRWRNGRGQRDC